VANYLARVELHKATGEDYETLHEAMRKRGFARFILSSEKKKYRLPTGTYVAEGSTWTLTQAYDFAVTAANDTGKSSWIIVVDWQNGRFSLAEVN
jgi:hypothetical protein